MKHLLFYIPYKICKHSFISIDFTASVYELFDNPSYVLFEYPLFIFFVILLSAMPLALLHDRV